MSFLPMMPKQAVSMVGSTQMAGLLSTLVSEALKVDAIVKATFSMHQAKNLSITRCVIEYRNAVCKKNKRLALERMETNAVKGVKNVVKSETCLEVVSKIS